MTETVILPVRLILPDEILEDSWISFENGTIKDFGQGQPRTPGERVDGLGLFLAPGFVDTHVHGGGGFDFLDGTAEAFRAISDYHLSRGTTALCPTLATSTYERFGAVLDVWSQVKDVCAARILPVHLEGPHLATTKAGAQDPKLMCAPTDDDIAWLVENASRISQMTIAPELPNALQLIRRCAQVGIVTSAGHTEAREESVRSAIGHGLSKVTHLFNAMTYAAKDGLLRQPGLAEYALVEDNLTCELVADGFHAAPILMKLAVRGKGPGRLALISDALAGTGLPTGSTFMLGSLRCKMGDGVCMLADGSALAGSATSLIDQVRIMHRTVHVPITDAVRMASCTPASVLGVGDRYGSIARGRAADFVQFDDEFGVRGVWVGGELKSTARPHVSREAFPH
jgi:N-acetylglucosamine-6-phosphate deacetylase